MDSVPLDNVRYLFAIFASTAFVDLSESYARALWAVTCIPRQILCIVATHVLLSRLARSFIRFPELTSCQHLHNCTALSADKLLFINPYSYIHEKRVCSSHLKRFWLWSNKPTPKRKLRRVSDRFWRLLATSAPLIQKWIDGLAWLDANELPELCFYDSHETLAVSIHRFIFGTKYQNARTDGSLDVSNLDFGGSLPFGVRCSARLLTTCGQKSNRILNTQ